MFPSIYNMMLYRVRAEVVKQLCDKTYESLFFYKITMQQNVKKLLWLNAFVHYMRGLKHYLKVKNLSSFEVLHGQGKCIHKVLSPEGTMLPGKMDVVSTLHCHQAMSQYRLNTDRGFLNSAKLNSP